MLGKWNMAVYVLSVLIDVLRGSAARLFTFQCSHAMFMVKLLICCVAYLVVLSALLCGAATQDGVGVSASGTALAALATAAARTACVQGAPAVIVRGGQNITCTSVFHALSKLTSGDTLFFMPGVYDLDDNCGGGGRSWNTGGHANIALIGLGNVTLRRHHYGLHSYPLLFQGVTNFTMRNITIDVHQNRDGYCFGINTSRNVLIENCKFFLRADGTGTVCKTLVVVDSTNNIVRGCVIGTFGVASNVLFHMATHGDETVVADGCFFIDNSAYVVGCGGDVRFSVGALVTRQCYANTLFGGDWYLQRNGIKPLPRAVAVQVTDHLYESMISAYGSEVDLDEPVFSHVPIRDKYIVIAPGLPDIPGYCGSTFAGVIPHGFTGAVRVVGIEAVGATFAPRGVTNIHAVIDYAGSRLLMSVGGCVVEVPRVHNSYVEFRNLVMTDAGTTGNPASFGVRAYACTNSTFVMRDSVLERTKLAESVTPLAAATSDGNHAVRCVTYNCTRVTYTNAVCALGQFGCINNMTLDCTNGVYSKAILTP